MAKALWQGYIALGQLGVPVRLYRATQDSRPRFVQLHSTDGSPVERVLRCRREGRPIDQREVVRAVEYEAGRYIAFTGRELARAMPGAVKTIVVRQFSDETAIEPVYCEKPFYVAPMPGGERAYALMRDVFARTGACAITEFVLYGKEHIGALMRRGDLLMLLQLRFAAELVPRDQIRALPLPKPAPAEVDALTALVERFRGPLYMQDYHDDYAERIRTLIERKIQGVPLPRTQRHMPHATPEDEIVPTLQRVLGTGQTLDGPAPINRDNTP